MTDDATSTTTTTSNDRSTARMLPSWSSLSPSETVLSQHFSSEIEKESFQDSEPQPPPTTFASDAAPLPQVPNPATSRSTITSKWQKLQQHVKKAGVAVSGGTMVGVGLIMIPLPTPFGCVVAGAGMAVLGTEFPQAQRLLDQSRDFVVDAIETNCGVEDDKELVVADDDDDNDCHPIIKVIQEVRVDTDENENENETTGKGSQEEPSLDNEEEYGVVRITTLATYDISQATQEPLQESPPPPCRKQPIMQEFSISYFMGDSIKRRAKMLAQKAIPVLKMIGTKETMATQVTVDHNNDKSGPQQPPTTFVAYDLVPDLSPLSVQAPNVPSWSSSSLTGSCGTYDESI